MKLNTATTLSVILAILFIAISCAYTYITIKRAKPKTKNKNKNKKATLKPAGITLTVITIISIICATHFISLTITAKKHGLTNKNITIAQAHKSIKVSNAEDTLPDKLKGSIIIYYDFENKDCETIYTELKDKTKDNKNIYWVSINSEQGKDLMEKYVVDEIPSAIYILNHPEEYPTEYIRKTLAKTKDDKTTLNTTNVDRLLQLQKEAR